ncbi:MAG: hypothetical protein HY074_13000 [Deltaproteobacteria bacterium]|nr:hypothetical protein [Deltaproteobacteria bacterium]
MQADAVVLNPKANAGAGAERWKLVRVSPLGRQLVLDRAPVFDGTGTVLSLDLAGFLREQLLRGARRFVIAGGDGTVNLVLSAYLRLCMSDLRMPRDARFGAVGIGSSNDFQKPFDAKGRARVAGFACRLDFDHAFAHDVGTLETAETAETIPEQENRYFFVNASMGVTAEANDRFNQGGRAFEFLKRRWVDGAIVAAALSTFAGYQNRKIRVQVGQGSQTELLLTNLSVIKNRFFSGSFHYDQGQRADDGLLGVRMCSAMNRFEMLAALKGLASGKFSGRPKTSSGTATLVQVQSTDSTPLAIETDGEVMRATSCRFGIVPKGVVLCP